MFFQFGAQLEESDSVKWISTEPVQPKQYPEANRCAAAQAATPWDLFHN
jgi:hypothetical protein